MSDTSSQLVGRGRPRLHTPEEVRSACIAAGIEELREHGLHVGLRGVSIDTASMAAGISRASSYRAWKDESDSGPGPQARFQTAVAIRVLAELVADQGYVVGAVFELLNSAAGSDDPDVLATFIPSMASDARERLFAEVVATATKATVDSLGVNSLWHTQIALVASLRSREDGSPEMMNALLSGEQNSATQYVEIYQFMLQMFGIRVKAHYEYEHFALAVAALSEAMTLRRDADIVHDLTRPGDSDAGRWSLFGVACMGLVKEFCEPDADSPFPTDPARC